jgi:hypothetical protein
VQDLIAAGSRPAPVIFALTGCRQISSKLHTHIRRRSHGLADRPCTAPLLQQSPVLRHGRLVALDPLAAEWFSSRFQGSGCESRITRCGCFRFARSQSPANCTFPKVLMVTTQVSMYSLPRAAYELPELLPARSGTLGSKEDGKACFTQKIAVSVIDALEQIY